MYPPRILQMVVTYQLGLAAVHPVISSVYSLFSGRVGLPPHNTLIPGVLMKSIGAAFLRPDALPDVNHIRGMQYKIVLNIIFWPEIN